MIFENLSDWPNLIVPNITSTVSCDGNYISLRELVWPIDDIANVDKNTTSGNSDRRGPSVQNCETPLPSGVRRMTLEEATKILSRNKVARNDKFSRNKVTRNNKFARNKFEL